MGAPTGDIEVVVFADDGPAAARAPRHVRLRRWSAAPLLALVLLAVIGGPVVVEEPAEEVAAPTPTTAAPATEAPGACPSPATRRLWCSFVGDDACCPLRAERGQPPSPPSPPSEMKVAAAGAVGIGPGAATT